MKKSVISAILCFVLAINFIFAGCTFGGLSGNISDYTIVLPENATDYEQNAAQYIKDEISERTKKEIPIVSETSKQTRNEILIGCTNRRLSAETAKVKTEGLEFVINSDKNGIALQGDYFLIAAAAYYFINEYITDDGIDTNLPKTSNVLIPTQQKANNYFLLIGDGMGVNHTRFVEYYDASLCSNSDNEKAFHGYLLPNQGKINTNSLSGITDSAAAATAMATGYRTLNGYVGKDNNGNDVKSLTELAVELGFKTAVMSTEVPTGATPAGFSAHAKNRSDTATIANCQKAMNKTDINCGFNEQSWNEIEKIVRDQIDKLQSNKGTFIMYEEAYIDKYSHERNKYSAYYMVLRFDQVIGVFMEYAMYHPDTMVIITADHETGGITLNENGAPEYTTSSHTSKQVPIFAYGEGTEYFNGKERNNNEIAKFIAKLWGVDNFGA